MTKPNTEALRSSFKRKKKEQEKKESKKKDGKSLRDRASESIRGLAAKPKSVFKKKPHTLEEELAHSQKVSDMYARHVVDLKKENEALICKLQREKIWHHKHRNIAEKHKSIERSYIDLNEKHEELRDLAFQLQQKLKVHTEKSKGMTGIRDSSDSLIGHVSQIFSHNASFASFIAEMKEDLEDELSLDDDEKCV
uniref:Uncharacterized protein n=1 Tax=Attheya septentrionalis TaxID=420275 RepID=A0A7S2USA3_9STRA|mmetsp:Transcript_8357/g.15143  ORF Transcript_8357/g.15143 Transcript_8357/m.15143 type:complete len:195 (+) Transcript_8357:119-703(+)